jgi:hypothetical protein
MVKAAHDEGIKIMAYFSVAFDNYALGVNPDWIYIESGGEPRRLRPFFLACMNSPYRDYAKKQKEELDSQYSVDGVWLDIVPLTWGGYREIGWFGEIFPPCYCVYCSRKFKELYGKDIPLNPTYSEKVESYQFLVNTMKSFLEESYKIIRKYRPKAIITYNNAGSPQDPVNNADLISIEGHAPDYRHQSMIARWGKCHSKPFEIPSPGALTGWNGWDQKPAKLLQLETSIAVAHGGTCTIGQAPRPDGSPEKGDFDAFKNVFSWIRKIEDYTVGVKGVSDIGLILSLKPFSVPNQGVEALQDAEGFHDAMLEGSFQYDVIEEQTNLIKYSLVIVPNQIALSDSEVKIIREYVADGGNLIITGHSSLMDEKGIKRDNFALADTIGAKYCGQSQWDFSFVRMVEEKLWGMIPDVPIKIAKPLVFIENKKSQVLANVQLPETWFTKNTTVLWNEPPGDVDRVHPIITLNQFKKGKCMYVATPIGASVKELGTSSTPFLGGIQNCWCKQLIINMVDYMLPKKVLVTNAPPACEVVLNWKAGKYILNLINHYTGFPDGLSVRDNSIKLSNIKISLNLAEDFKAQRIFLIPDRKEIEFSIVNSRIEFTVPEFDVHSIIVIE